MKNITDYIIESQTNVNGFVILKPGFINHYDELHSTLVNNKWDVLDTAPITLTLPQAQELYLMHKEKDFYNDLCKYMSSGKCICMKCYKKCNDPIEQMASIKDEFRKNYEKDEMRNCMHSSDSLENVKREAKIIFK